MCIGKMSLDYLFCCLSAVLETRPGPLVIEEIWFIVIPPLPMPFNWAGYLVQEIISASLLETFAGLRNIQDP